MCTSFYLCSESGMVLIFHPYLSISSIHSVCVQVCDCVSVFLLISARHSRCLAPVHCCCKWSWMYCRHHGKYKPILSVLVCVWGVDRKRETETRTTRGEERMERRKLKVRQRETNINWEYGDSQGWKRMLATEASKDIWEKIRKEEKGGKRREQRLKTRKFVGSVDSSTYAVTSQAISLNSTQGQSFGNQRKEKEEKKKRCDDRTMLLTSAGTSQTLMWQATILTSSQPSVCLSVHTVFSRCKSLTFAKT